MSKNQTIRTTAINAQAIFEEEILHSLLDDRNYFNVVIPHMEKSYFSEIGNSILFDKIQRYHAESGKTPNIKELAILLKDDPRIIQEVAVTSLAKVQDSALRIDETLLLNKTEDFIRKAIHTESLILGAEGMGENNDKKLAESFDIAQKANSFVLEDKSTLFRTFIKSGKKIMGTIYPLAKNVNTTFIPLQKGVLTMISGRGGSCKGISVLRSALIYLESHPNDKALLWFTEDSERTIQSRIDALNVSDDVLNRISIMTENPSKFNFKNTDIAEITQEYDFVVIDPLSHFYFGDENNNNEVAKFMSDFNNSCIEANNITILVHHHSKQGETRGAGAFADNSRLVYHLHKEPNGDTKCVRFKENANIQGNKEIIITPWDIKHPVPLNLIINTGLNLGTTGKTAPTVNRRRTCAS